MPEKPPDQVYEIFIQAPPERVWDAITRGDLTRRYFHGTTVRSTLEPGTPFNYYMDPDDLMVEGTVIASERPRRLVHTWHALWNDDVARDSASTVTWLIEPREGGSQLTLLHAFEREGATYREVGGGWSSVLEGLKGVAEAAHEDAAGA